MRLTIKCKESPREIIAEEFSIPGSTAKFAVHQAVGTEEKGLFSATHCATGLRIASGDTIDEAIANGINAWNSRSPAERQRAINLATRLGL